MDSLLQESNQRDSLVNESITNKRRRVSGLGIAMMQEDMIDDLNGYGARFSTIRITLSLLPFQSILIATIVVVVLILDSLVMVCGDSSSPTLVRWSLPMKKVRVAHTFERLARLGWIQRMPSVQIWQLYTSSWI